MNLPIKEIIQKNSQSSGFSPLGVEGRILQVLEYHRFHTPTLIQEKAIPVALKRKDIVGIAQTGTGKTLAFALPIIQRLIHCKEMSLILLPTRELAVQIQETFNKVGASFGVRTALLIGGVSPREQVQSLRRQPHVIIGTPGRIIDHLQQNNLSLKGVSTLVLDEADRMLDMGFAPQIKTILQMVPHQRQTLLFSATMPDKIMQLANHYMQSPVRIEIAKPGTASAQVRQLLYIISKNQKMRLLEAVLRKYSGTVLVFSRTKYGAKKICRDLKLYGHSVAEIHSNKSFGQRQDALKGFKSGRFRILVATDIASRGIDVKEIELVINFDVPEQCDDYVHRIGRTGRADHSGCAITFATPDQGAKIREIERLIRLRFNPLPLPELPVLPSIKTSPSSKNPSSHKPAPFGRPRWKKHKKT